MKKMGLLLSAMLVLFLSACDVKNTPIPLQDSPLIGIWEGHAERVKDDLIQIDRMYLEFTEEGYVAFQRVNCWAYEKDQPRLWKTKNFHIDFMPIIKINMEKITAQWMPLTPKLEFSLDAWPAAVDGVMRMTVDGLELQLTDTPSDRSAWGCAESVAH